MNSRDSGQDTMARTILTVPDLAKRWSCSENHVRNLYKAGLLKSFKVGHLVRFRIEDVMAYEGGEPEKELSPLERWRRSREGKAQASA